MNSNIQIEFDYLEATLNAKLVPNMSIALYLLYHKAYKEFERFRYLIYQTEDYYDMQYFKKLESEGYIKIVGNDLPNDLEFRPEFTIFINPINPKINFDEFWDAFPATTRTGRVLRAVNKMNNQGKPTRDYEVCKKKYLAKVKSEEVHKRIVSIIKARVASGDYEYINGIEIYINQSKWERDEVYLRKGKTTSSINKMI